MDRAAADDVDRALELAVRVRLRFPFRRHDDEVEREILRARGLARHTEVVRDLLLRFERHRTANAYRPAVALYLRPGRHCTPPFVIGSASRIFRSLSSGRTFSSRATSISGLRSSSARFTRAADFA